MHLILPINESNNAAISFFIKVAEYDEHSLVTTFKFGLIYQKFGQVSEEALFGNRTHSPAMEEFMQLLGQVITLSDHQGYRGGLDTKHGQTGEHALYETFRGCEPPHRDRG